MSVNRRIIRSSLLVGIALIGSAIPTLAQEVTPPAAAPEVGVLVDSVAVTGNQRVPEADIRVATAIQKGKRVAALDIQNAVRRLMATGNFSDVQVVSTGDPAQGVTLIFEVQERPLITAYSFTGLNRVSPKTVRDTLGLKDNTPLNPNTIARTQQMIRDLLAKQGIQLISVDTSLTPVSSPEGAYRLTFDVHEGNRLSIADVDFVGNEHFDDDALRGAIKTQKEGFLWLHSGKFDREKWDEDLGTRLPEFYGSKGFIDFSVAGDSMVVDPETGKARLIVTVNEGPQYRLGEFKIVGATHFPSDQLEKLFTSQRRSVLGLPFSSSSREAGEVFDQSALDAATKNALTLYNNEGYLFAQIIPRIERVPAAEAGASPTVNVTWAVSEQTPFYINTVAIEGNTHTHESVIRDRLTIYPGDVYNQDRLIQSYRSIAALGFFETNMPPPDIDPDPATSTVNITFHVKEKQTGSINFGTAIGGGGYGRSGGLSGFLGFTEPNLFGLAKQVEVRAEYGFGRSSFTAAYTDPAIFGTRNSASVSVFHTDDSWRGLSFSEGRYMRTGASLQWGFPIPGLRWTRAFAGYSLSRYRYEATDVQECDVGNIFCQPNAVASDVSLTVTRDTKNHPLFPTAGTRQSIALDQTGGPLGGDGNFQKLTSELEWWVPVGRAGGGMAAKPINTTFGLMARAGAVFGDASRFPFSRFFLGGTQWGEPLRGYGESEITPFGFCPTSGSDGTCTLNSNQRIGNAFLTVTGQYAVRFNDNLSVNVFADAGNIWSSPGLIDPSNLYRSAGIGATIVTPFGPLGIDLAYGFDRIHPGFKFHFKINQTGF
jgi:outer membrane protein insertion porin family